MRKWKVEVMRSTEYKDKPLYVLRFHTIFQYLFVHDNNIYQHHIFLKPRWLPFVSYILGFRDVPYSSKELDAGEQAVMNGAMKSIDALLRHDTDKKKKD